MSAEPRDHLIRGASTGVLKAGFALGLMSVFFALFFLAPGVALGGVLFLVLLFEFFRRR